MAHTQDSPRAGQVLSGQQASSQGSSTPLTLTTISAEYHFTKTHPLSTADTFPAMSSSPASLSYHEPSITTILILSSFLLLLNTVNYILDRIVYCGLIGQIFIGVGWGIPGTGWLSREVQDTVMQLGYLGLVLIVYEGAPGKWYMPKVLGC